MKTTSLFSRTVKTLSLTLLLVILLTLLSLFYFIMLPVGERSADDLASLIELSTYKWERLPPTEQPEFRARLQQRHRLQLREDNVHTEEISAGLRLPYFHFLEEALHRRFGLPILLHRDAKDHQRYWIDIPVAAGKIHIGIPSDRVQASPPIAIALVISIAMLATLIASLLIASHISAPLVALARAVSSFGMGNTPKPLSETGPQEIATLTRTFNAMVLQIRSLQDNRTVMLSGISHDLRTPLTRAGLAIEMLSLESDPVLVDQLRHDMEEMNRLIGLFLEMSHGLSRDHSEVIDIPKHIQEIITHAQRSGSKINYQGVEANLQETHPVALKRIITNLLENAIRYGNGSTITVTYREEAAIPVISICDQGPGIPENEYEAVMRPFHRLEQSRSDATGGSGLGLSIVSQLANAHGWHVKLKPNKGGGLCVQLNLL